MIRKQLGLLFLLLLIGVCDATAQFYPVQHRLPKLNWQELTTDRFRVIYPAAYQQEAERTMAILELEYDDIQAFVDGDLRRFPVILNPNNDRSNGFVTPFNFRSEIELAPIRGKALSPRSGDWLESVVPHELVHALHFSSVQTGLVGNVTRLFSNDAARSLHGAAPSGFLEGVAVHHESHNTMPHSGRGNYPFFSNQFTAMLDADQWSMGRVAHISSFTPPFNRHYIGGYEFVAWLTNTYGEDTMRKAIRRHHQYPFLGMGMALRNVTGSSPARLYRDFETYQNEKEQQRLSALNSTSLEAASAEVPFYSTCTQIRRPLWIDDQTVLFHARTCNRPTGFYTVDLETQKSRLIHEVSIVEDQGYSLDSSRRELLFARYHVHPIYQNVFRSDIHRLNLQSGKSDRITVNGRISYPKKNETGLYGLQTVSQHLQLVTIDPDGSVGRIFPMRDNSSVVEFDLAHHDPATIAIVGKRHGVQALWIESVTDVDTLLTRDPDVAFTHGSIFDPQWHPSKPILLFSSDHTGELNLYEYHIETDQIVQKTESLFNAFEGAWSLQGDKLALIRQRGNEQIPYTVPAAALLDRTVYDDMQNRPALLTSLLDRPLLNRTEEADQSSWNQQPHRTGFGWLVPRIWVPTLESRVGPNSTEFGIRMESVDVLSEQAYSVEVTNFAERFWYDIQYRNRSFYPGFEARFFSRPTFNIIRVQDENQDTFFVQNILQQRGGSLSLPFVVRLEQNARFSSLFIEPEYILSQLKFRSSFDSRNEFSDFATQHTVGLSTNVNINLRQFVRDVQPNTGLSFFTQTRVGLNRADLSITIPGLQTFEGVFSRRQGFRAGVIGYVSPLRRWNQSLRLSFEGITQSDVPVFDIQSRFSDHFGGFPLAGQNNVGIIGTRYTIPLTYPDDGGLLVPAYLSNIYLLLFSQSVGDISSLSTNRFSNSSQTVIGAGIRTRFRFGNVLFDMGLSLGWHIEADRVSVLFTSN
ncbi:MAG: hypothetical protein ACNA78_00640 [Balneolaceae bacterium]